MAEITQRLKEEATDGTRRARLLAEKQALLEKLASLEQMLGHEDTAGRENRLEAAEDALANPASEVATVTLAPPSISAQNAPEPNGRRAPLSFAQQRLWFIYQLDPGSPAYNIPSALGLKGRLDVTALENSFDEIIRRHEALRTTFEVIDQEPVQVVWPENQVKLQVLDLEHWPDRQGEAEAWRLVVEDAHQPFDLVRGPLIRVNLLRLSADEHWLVVTMHHIVSDAWSMGVLIGELTALYAAYMEGKPSPLAPLAMQYPDFAVWQRQWLQGERLQAQLAYWKARLGGVPNVIDLPTDRPRSPGHSFRGADERLTLSGAVSQALRRLSQTESATLFMILLAAFQVLLRRYTGQDVVVVGVPIANRNRGGIEGLIGFFVNSLVMRVDLSGNPTFAEAVRRVREVALDAYAHQDLPFEMIIDELQPERTASYNPVFQVVFSMLNTPDANLELAGLTISGLGSGLETGKFDLTMRMMEREGKLVALLGYNTDLFDAETIRRMLGHFKNLLEAVAADPRQRILSLPILDAEERGLLLSLAGREATDAIDERLDEMFEWQAAARPDRLALTFEHQQMTYRELNVRANRLAHRLIRPGTAAEQVVAICLEPGAEMIVAVLAVLKAGAAYLPLEVDLPQERLEWMIADCRVDLVVTSRQLAQKLQLAGVRVISLDGPAEPAYARETAGLASQNLGVRGAAEQLAYVIYTSGSTGKPKGVGVTHANVARLLRVSQERFAFSDADVWTLFHSLGFDFSVWEVWGALGYAGRLVVVPYWVRREPAAFAGLVRQEGVTVLNQTPSAFYQYMGVHPRGGEARGGEQLRLVILGGEALEVRRLKEWKRRMGRDVKVVNMYGITETTVHVTYKEIGEEEIERGRSAIGQPLEDMQVYVLDDGMEVVPIGVSGELCVGGGGVARGYLRREAMTAERYVPDAYSGRAGWRLYRSADLGRWMRGEDGYSRDGYSREIEYLGRADSQVKVRGYRIEVGEVEAALMEHPAVKLAAVTVREDVPGDKRLVAYLVARPGPAPAADGLRGFLRDRLPEHMTPSAFAVMDELPLTANGKLDRRALPPPAGARPDLEKCYVGPRNSLERSLVELWQQVLRLERVGVEDDFFALGGDSIRGAVLINELQSKLGQIIHVVAIFKASTVSSLAAYLAENYLDAVAGLMGDAVDSHQSSKGLASATSGPLDLTKVEQMRRLIKPLGARPRSAVKKNRPAIFILSAPRSGSTLLRVMLGGHPRLFAPPELELLSFNTLVERRDAFPGQDGFWLEGTVRAIMQIKGVGAGEAKGIMRRCEEQQLTTQDFYRLLQEWLGERRLIDKTPSYAFDPAVLERAEEDFEGVQYIHLFRHPCGMIQSFEEYRLDQIFFRYDHPFSRRELAELTWLISNQNIVRFLEPVPRERKHQVRFEELTAQPQAVLENLCQFLGLAFHPGLLRPYEQKREKMTDGIHAESRMLGDVKFHSYTEIDSHVAGRWKGALSEDLLGGPTRQIAEALGYHRARALRSEGEGYLRPEGEMCLNRQSSMRAGPSRARLAYNEDESPLREIQQGTGEWPFFCVHPVAGGAIQYARLALHLGAQQTFYGLEGLDPDKPYIEIEERAANYIEAIRRVRGRGPYLLGGWSFGGLVAFEMAQQLQRDSQEVALLALFDPMLPIESRGKASALSLDSDDPVLLVEQISELAGLDFQLASIHLRRMGRDEQLEQIIALMKSTPVVPPEVGPENILNWLRGYRAKLKSACNYVPQVYPGRITLFQAEQADQSNMRDNRTVADPRRRWAELSSDPIEVRSVSGTHHTMIFEPHVQGLARRLQSLTSNFWRDV
jgi:amino acid adenylation domain-containing protein